MDFYHHDHVLHIAGEILNDSGRKFVLLPAQEAHICDFLPYRPLQHSS